MIRNTINHKIYIGQSIRIEKRWKNHIYEAEKQRRNLNLYNAMRKYGVENFEFKIIEECEKEQLNEREVFWIKYYQSLDKEKGYNNTTGGHSNFKCSAQVKEKISRAMLKQSKQLSIRTTHLWKNEDYKNKVISNREASQQNAKAVNLYKDNELKESFTSIWNCTHYLVNNGYGDNFEYVRSNIRKHIKRDSKTFMSDNIQIRYKDLQRL